MRPAAVPSFEIGAVVADTYTIEREVGRGGMGVVLLASHNRLPGKKVAIKVLQAQLAGDELLARFKREAHIVSVLAHPNIVHIEDFNVTPDGTPYLVLEFLRGESLAERLARGALDLDLALTIARQVGSALSAAHARHIVHRDLKPQNVFLLEGDQVVAKVLDFGISKMLDSDTVKTDDQSLLGTPQYMAPEQATGQTDAVGPRSDVFSFGAIVYEMLAGTPPFTGRTVPEVVFKAVYEQPVPLPAHVPENVVAAVKQAMAKAPAERFATASSFVEALTGQRVSSPGALAASGKSPAPSAAELAQTIDSGATPKVTLDTIVPKAAAAPTPAPAPARRRRSWWIASAALAAVAIAVVALVLSLRHRDAAPHKSLPGADRLRSVADQLANDEVVLDGRRFHVDVTGSGLRVVKFEVDEHPYEAVEQNPAKKSRWAKLAREGHRVVQFKDNETNRYFAVVVDGQPKRLGEGVPVD